MNKPSDMEQTSDPAPILNSLATDQQAYRVFHGHLCRVWSHQPRLLSVLQWNEEETGAETDRLRFLILLTALISEWSPFAPHPETDHEMQGVFDILERRACLQDATELQRIILRLMGQKINRLESVLELRCRSRCRHCGHRTRKSGLKCDVCRRFLEN